MANVAPAAQAAGMAVGLLGDSPESARAAQTLGFKVASVGPVAAFLRASAASARATASGEAAVARLQWREAATCRQAA